MPTGTCDPATRGDAYNEGQFVQGPVTVTYRYGWDGTSVRPECVGPVIYLSGTNASPDTTYYAHFQGRKGTWLRRDLPPGQTITVTSRGQLRSAGFDTNQDVEGLFITADPNPPSVFKG